MGDMPSGYEKSPDYGGWRPTPPDIALAIAAFIGVAVIYYLAAY
jgi:hypothetical protein